MEQPRCAVGGGNGGERNGFRPACRPVQDREEIGVACRAGKLANQIDMNMSETAAGNFNLLWLQLNMLMQFAALAMEACPG